MQSLSLVTLAAALLMVLAALDASPAQAHCQVPCGIYDDHARVHAMLEDVATMDKAVKAIVSLVGKTDAQSANQRVRWINTKEAHGSHIIKVISEYFLTQKIKRPGPKNKRDWKRYIDLLAAHHLVMIRAMKAKQTVEARTVGVLRDSIVALQVYWPGKKRPGKKGKAK